MARYALVAARGLRGRRSVGRTRVAARVDRPFARSGRLARPRAFAPLLRQQLRSRGRRARGTPRPRRGSEAKRPPPRKRQRARNLESMGLGRVELPTSRLSGREIRRDSVTTRHHRPRLTNNLLSTREFCEQSARLRAQDERLNGHRAELVRQAVAASGIASGVPLR